MKKKEKHTLTVLSIAIGLVLILYSCVDLLSKGDLFYKRLNYRIIVSQEPTQIELFAAEELKYFLNEIYSEPIVLNGNKTNITFFVGDVNQKVLSKNDFRDGLFGVFYKDNQLLFTGSDSPDVNPATDFQLCAGTASSVYYFLTKYMGVNFYFPGENGYEFKKNPPLIFNESSDVPEPSFIVRGISVKNSSYTPEENILFFRRLLGNVPYWAKRDYYYYYLNKWKTRFENSHPEYLGLYNGKRSSGKYPYHLPCFSNPAVIKQSVDDILNILNEDPTIKTIRIFADCPLQFCECDNCITMPERKYIGETEENGEMVYGIAKKIIDEVHKFKPDIQLLVQTKLYTNSGSYFKPSKLVTMGSQCTILHLTRRNRMPLFNHTKEVEIAKEWLKDSVTIVLKSYERYPEAKDYPLIKPHLDRDFLRLFLGIATGTTDSEASTKSPYSFSALGQYLQMKMLFDINIDLDKEIVKFCTFAYPGAQNEMVKFYTYMEDIYSKRSEFSKPLLDDVYKFENNTKAMNLLDQAAGKLNSESVYFDQLHNDFLKFHEEALRYKLVQNNY